MTKMNIPLPDSPKAIADQQIDACRFGTSSEYVRDLIRKYQDQQALREVLVAGAQSSVHGPSDAPYFSRLRANIAKKSST